MSWTARCLMAGALVSVLALEGCAGMTINQPLKDEYRNKISSTQLYLNVPQHELYAAINPSNLGQTAAASCGAVPGLGILLAGVCGGIAGASDAAINASRAKEADKQVGPLKDALLDVAFEQQLQQQFTQVIGSVPGLNVGDISIIRNDRIAEVSKLVESSQASAVLLITADYHLSPDFSHFLFVTQTFMFPRAADLRAQAGQVPDPKNVREGVQIAHPGFSIYNGQLSYAARLPEPAKDVATNVKLWQADNGALLRKAWAQALSEVPGIIASELGQTSGSSSRSGHPAKEEKIKVDNVSVVLLRQTSSGKLVRYVNGAQIFVGDLKSTTPAVPPVAVSNIGE